MWNQEKLALYKNAADYAKEHNLALGQALSADQVKALDAPMLWYVEQAVPDPRCTLASTVCPSVNALVPQVYLPEGYAQALSVPTGGTISGENIKLTIDGQLRNTGQVIAQDTLTVKAESIDLSPNVVSIGTNAYKAESLNNATGSPKKPGTPEEIRKMLEQERRAFGQTGTVPNSGGSDGPAMVGPSPLVLGGARSGATSPVGVSGSPMTVPRGTNSAAPIGP